MFIFHVDSRRAANREIGTEKIAEFMKSIVSNTISAPHADTLNRLLAGLDENALEECYEEVLREFINSSTFKELNPGSCVVAIDGSQMFSRSYCWDERTLSRNAGNPERERYSAYVVESLLILENGMALPLLTEFLENGEQLDGAGKQDCETKAFKRLIPRLAKLLGNGCVTVVMDGLYATGPVISLCKKYGFEYMITLKEDSLTTVWEDFNGLRKIETDNVQKTTWGDREQTYRWSNGIEYIYGANNKCLSINIVTCEETWYEAHPRTGKPDLHVTEYAWISSSKVNDKNVFRLCTKIARRRWRIENNFLVEKHQGYSFEHCFSYNWDAMKGFHVLMKFGHFINTLLTHSELLTTYVSAEGIRGVVRKVMMFLIVRGASDFHDDITSLQRHGRRVKMRFKTLKIKLVA